jgi:hypothetical protein
MPEVYPFDLREASSVRLLAEWYAKGKQGRRRWSKLRSDDVWLFPHRLPNEKCHIIHVEKTYLIAVLASLTVDANRRQKFHLVGLGDVMAHADRGRILKIADIRITLRDDPIVQRIG